MAGEMNSPDIAAASAAPAEAGSNTAPASNTAGSAVIDTATAAVASTTSSSGGDTGTTTEGGAKVVGGAEAAKSAAAPRETRFIFKELVGKPFAPLEDKDTQGLLAKWTMLDSMRVFRYKFDQKFQLYDMETFVNDFLNDPSVLGTMKILSNTRVHGPTLGRRASAPSQTPSHSHAQPHQWRSLTGYTNAAPSGAMVHSSDACRNT